MKHIYTWNIYIYIYIYIHHYKYTCPLEENMTRIPVIKGFFVSTQITALMNSLDRYLLHLLRSRTALAGLGRGLDGYRVLTWMSQEVSKWLVDGL